MPDEPRGVPAYAQPSSSSWGDAFFERVLRQFFESYVEADRAHSVLEILEPFDGYIVAPAVLRELYGSMTNAPTWVCELAQYEWALWQAKRVAMGWPALYDAAPLAQGSTLVRAGFDLPKLLTAIRRLQSSSVGPDAYEWRVRPPSGEYLALIFARAGEAVEARLGRAEFDALEAARVCAAGELPGDTHTLVAEIGVVLDMSFLCCPRAEESGGEVQAMISGLVAPLPH